MLLITLVVIDVAAVLLRENWQIAEGELAERFGVMRSQHQSEVIHTAGAVGCGS